jgi:hypothetical protein
MWPNMALIRSVVYNAILFFSFPCRARLALRYGSQKMSLTEYEIHNYPHDFAVTKVDAPLDQCAFLLDFDR